MTIDTNKRYLLHNIYGDAVDLIATAPADVVCVPAGWDAATEAARNSLFAAMGIGGVSCLPALLHFVPEADTADGEGGTFTVPAHWAELRVADMARPWSWAAIEAAMP